MNETAVDGCAITDTVTVKVERAALLTPSSGQVVQRAPEGLPEVRRNESKSTEPCVLCGG